MNRLSHLAALCLVLFGLGGCSTEYQSTGLTGGYDQTELEPGIWRVGFAGNGFTTPETVQTYWLYRCAELALDKGFEGFEIVSNVQLTDNWRPVQVAGAAPVYVPMYYDQSPKPSIEADIRLLKKPFSPLPGKRFDAADLKSRLTDLVKGKKCDSGNVCPHVHHYLYPDDDKNGKAPGKNAASLMNSICLL